MIAKTVGALADQQAVGWFQGRMEFGPRALGARSILGDPRAPSMQRNLNLKVKYRESFRPFAPAVLRQARRQAMTPEEQALFCINKLNVVRSEIPAVTHVDYSARIQTVPKRFKALTGCPVLVNTSFNVRGEPILCTPQNAFRCFMGNELDLLVVGRCVLHKSEQDGRQKRNYSSAVKLD
jgi:carbamoyltransferase